MVLIPIPSHCLRFSFEKISSNRELHIKLPRGHVRPLQEGVCSLAS